MMRCSKEAFALCTTAHLCGRREDAIYAEGSECDLFNQQVPDLPMTNADRIRAMTDEELGEFLCKICACNAKDCPGVEMCKYGDGKANGLKKWLKQPAKANYMSYQTVIDRCHGKIKNPFALDGHKYRYE